MTSILLIEDEDISRSFLEQALALLGAEITACAGFANALRACRGAHFDLIISDIHLGDGCLYDRHAAFPAGTPVLATSAGLDAGMRQRLRECGISDALAKPMAVAELHAAVIRLTGALPAAAPLWNEGKALGALGGNAPAVASLKSLFRAELPQMAAEIHAAYGRGDHEAVRACLHKLKASCGFLGADRLLQACQALDADITRGRLAQFQEAAELTLAAI